MVSLVQMWGPCCFAAPPSTQRGTSAHHFTSSGCSSVPPSNPACKTHTLAATTVRGLLRAACRAAAVGAVSGAIGDAGALLGRKSAGAAGFAAAATCTIFGPTNKQPTHACFAQRGKGLAVLAARAFASGCIVGATIVDCGALQAADGAQGWSAGAECRFVNSAVEWQGCCAHSANLEHPPPQLTHVAPSAAMA